MPRPHYNRIRLKHGKKYQFCELDLLLNTKLSACINEISASHSLLMDHYESEDLHQTRVTLRKMRSLLRFFKNEISYNNWKMVNSMINNLIKPTSEVRDFDVISNNYIFPACHQNSATQESKILLDKSNKELTKLHENTIKTLSSIQYRNLLEDVHIWINDSKWQSSFPLKNIKGKVLSTLIENRLNHRYKLLRQRIDKISRLERKKLHKIRIDVKELRYLVDIFRFYIKKSKRHLNRLENLQTNLGVINDTYIAELLMNDLDIKPSSKNKKYIAAQISQQRSSCTHNLHTLI